MNKIITYYLIKIFSSFIYLFPRRFAIYLAIILGSLINIFFPKRKNVARKNLMIAFPQKTFKEINAIIKKTYQHYMILVVDFLKQKSFDHKKIIIDKQTKEILSKKDGLILMTAHIGNWEMMIPILNKFKKTTAIVKIQKNSGGDKFVSELRNFNNITLLSMGSNTKKMINALYQGEILALASDQNAENKGIKVPFFGKECSMPKGAGYFYYKTNLPIVIGFCMLNEDHTYSFQLEKINLSKNAQNIEEIFIEVSTIYNNILENKINEYPEQYFWFHRKWDRKIYEQ